MRIQSFVLPLNQGGAALITHALHFRRIVCEMKYRPAFGTTAPSGHPFHNHRIGYLDRQHMLQSPVQPNQRVTQGVRLSNGSRESVQYKPRKAIRVLQSSFDDLNNQHVRNQFSSRQQRFDLLTHQRRVPNRLPKYVARRDLGN